MDAEFNWTFKNELLFKFDLNKALQNNDLKTRELFFEQATNKLFILVKNISTYYVINMNDISNV